LFVFFFSSRRRHTRCYRDWSSDVCSSDLLISFVIWVLIVPALVALFLIFTFIAAFLPDLYFAATSFALAFAVVTMVWGPFWFGRSEERRVGKACGCGLARRV